ncbi:unnamed protein product, partial [Mesorhabditis spiculigera]
MYITLKLITLLALTIELICSKELPFLNAIEVPGAKVPIMRMFDNYAAHCKKEGERTLGMSSLAQIMHSLNAEALVTKMHDSLFSAIGDVEVRRLEGRWFSVVDTREVHAEECSTTEIEIIAQNVFTSTLSLITKVWNPGQTPTTNTGIGLQMGPEPGELLLSTGHSMDKCPYVVVKTFNANPGQPYDFIVLSQPLKYPTIVLARSTDLFQEHKKQVYDFLEKNGYLSPMAALNTRLHFVNVSACDFVE